MRELTGLKEDGDVLPPPRLKFKSWVFVIMLLMSALPVYSQNTISWYNNPWQVNQTACVEI